MFTSLIPDMDHFMGHHGGRVFQLYRDTQAADPNVAPGLLDLLADTYGSRVTGTDLVAYLAAVTGHRGFVRRFAADLATPGIRDTAYPRPEDLRRCGGNRPRAAVAAHVRQTMRRPSSGSSSETTEAGLGPSSRPSLDLGRRGEMPEWISYRDETRTLHVGAGQIAPVPPEVWRYQVSGMFVVKHWFDYRKKKPAGVAGSPLNKIIATAWTPAMTTELLDVLNVLGRCVELEPRQAALLDRIDDKPLITVEEDLRKHGVLPVPAALHRIPSQRGPSDLFSSQE